MDTPTLSVQELCESRGGRPGFPIPNNHYCLCGRKATLNDELRQELCESRGGRPGFPIPNNHYCLCGRKATLNDELRQELCESRGGRPYGLCERKATFEEEEEMFYRPVNRTHTTALRRNM